jgi:spermidine synthase
MVGPVRDLCDNTLMTKYSNYAPEAEIPLLHEENGELSLHFGFPTIQSRMLKADPERLILDYTRSMMGFLLFQPRPERIAMIGLGGGSLAKYCLRKLPDSNFIAVELSAEVIALRKDFGIPDDNVRFRILCEDGADFVRNEIESIDVLLVDGFDSGGQPLQLCSPDFYDNCHSALRHDGILAVNLCADDTACGCYAGRIRDAFSGKTIVIEADEGENRIVFAYKGRNFPPTFNELAKRLRTLESIHPVELDRTAQKILRCNEPQRAKWKKRRS